VTRTALLVPLLGIAWGLNWPAVRLCLDEIAPWTLRATGLAFGAAMLFAVLAATGRSAAVPPRHWWRVGAASFFSFSVYGVLTAFAQLLGSTARSSVLAATMPLWTVLLSRLFLAEAIDRRRQIGLGLGAAGLLALGWPLVEAGELSWSMLLAIGAGLSWALGAILQKRFPADAPPLVIAAWQLAFAAVIISAGALVVEGLPRRLPVLASTWTAFIYHVLVAQALATLIWVTMIGRLPAGIAAIGSLMVPGIGVVGAALILGEKPTLADWIGLALIVTASASVIVARQRPAALLAATPRTFGPGKIDPD
jgi:drug/metabolite transporter (DMT)-like permease